MASGAQYQFQKRYLFLIFFLLGTYEWLRRLNRDALDALYEKRKADEQKEELSASDSDEPQKPKALQSDGGSSDESAEETPKKKSKRGPKKSASAPKAKKAKTEKDEVKAPETGAGEDTDTWTNKETDSEGRKWNLKIASWNVAGIRAVLKKNGQDYIKKEDADIVCLQEVKCKEGELPGEGRFKGYHMYWCAGMKPGYAGVALYSKEKPLSVKKGLGKPEHDEEGRVITAEYEKFYVVGTYVPNAGQGLKTLPKRLKWNTDFENYLKELDEKKPVILVGDLNVAHEEIDLANPKTNQKSAGFTKEEREGMTHLLKQGFVDTFRHLYPDKKGAYTYWTYLRNARANNTGWRLDYFVLSERLVPNVCDNVMRSKVMGSDHCPIVLFLHV
nr:PREDICTED: uncharacterized protein LOC109032096 isoform X1 [Bemisia tabaci]